MPNFLHICTTTGKSHVRISRYDALNFSIGLIYHTTTFHLHNFHDENHFYNLKYEITKKNSQKIHSNIDTYFDYWHKSLRNIAKTHITFKKKKLPLSHILHYIFSHHHQYHKSEKNGKRIHLTVTIFHFIYLIFGDRKYIYIHDWDCVTLKYFFLHTFIKNSTQHKFRNISVNEYYFTFAVYFFL